MAESGCMKDASFHNIEVDGTLIVKGEIDLGNTVQTTTTVIGDALIKLGDGNDGALKDLGFVFSRTNDTLNRGFIWDESADTSAAKSGIVPE